MNTESGGEGAGSPVLLFPDGTHIEVLTCKTCGALAPITGAGDHETFHVVYT